MLYFHIDTLIITHVEIMDEPTDNRAYSSSTEIKQHAKNNDSTTRIHTRWHHRQNK